MAAEKIIMGLDIGSSWVRAIVGSISKDGQLMVDSLCERPSEGIRNGVITNLEQCYQTIASVIQESELQAGTEVQTVITGVGGSSIEGIQSQGVAGITTKGLEITSSDIYKSLEVARTFELPQDRFILHTLVQDFCVDGKTGIKDPIDMTGHRLESRALVVTGSQSNCMNAKKCLQKAGIINSRVVLSSIADAEVLISQDEKEMGTIIINIGSHTTNMIAYQNGSPVYVGGIDYGSNNVTQDVAYVLNKPRNIAESIKCEYGCCYTPSVGNDEMILIPNVGSLPSIQMPRKELTKIIEPRMAEIFSLLKRDLEEKGVVGSFGGGIIIVGGGALLSGVTELASEIFKIQARIGFPEALPGLDRSFINPKYTTVLGLLKTEAKKANNQVASRSKSSKHSSRKGMFSGIANFFKTVV